MIRISALFAIVMILSVIWQSPVTAQINSVPQPLIITEVKLGESKPVAQEPVREFVSIYNPNPTLVDLSGWQLEYARPGMDANLCGTDEWTGSTVKATSLDLIIEPLAVASVQIALTDDLAGSIRLVQIDDGERLVHDLVGWQKSDATTEQMTPCYDEAPAELPLKGKSIQRYLGCSSSTPVDTQDNLNDFYINSQPAMDTLPSVSLPECAPEETDNENSQAPDTSAEPTGGENCNQVMISELLPNPTGSDSGKEFIELYNHNASPAKVGGCGLQLGDGGVYWLEPATLAPGGYKVIYDGASGITLPNASGGTVYLLNPTLTEIQSVTYPGGMTDDVSWAWLDGSWEATYSPTPGSSNVNQPEKPCPVGQVRNEDTGRCINQESEATGLTACKPGQTRNPETNRCRAVTSATTTLVPCKPGQTRNPETNRCKAAATLATAQKPCADGWERNPETNRCRKIRQTTGQLADVTDVATPGGLLKWQWLMAGLAATGATGYGAYEWRDSIRRAIGRVKNRVRL